MAIAGAGDPKSAKNAATVGITVTTLTSLIYAGIILALRTFIPLAFSSNKNVISHTAFLLLIISGYAVLDAFQ